MLFRVDFKSPKPVYLQVAEQIKEAAASGTLRPGEALPAIGGLAGELRVNRNAIAKAYAELEELGVIEMRPGGQYHLKGLRPPPPRESPPKAVPTEIDQALTQFPLLLHKSLAYALLAVFLGGLYLGFTLGGGISLVWTLLAIAVALPQRDYGVHAARFSCGQVERQRRDNRQQERGSCQIERGTPKSRQGIYNTVSKATCTIVCAIIADSSPFFQ